MNVTDKQLQILKIISTGNGADDRGVFQPVDLDQLIERLVYKPTKASIQFSVRALIRRALIEKGLEHENRRGRKRVLFTATPLGHNIVTLAINPSFAGTVSPPLPDLADLTVLREAEVVHSADSSDAGDFSEPQVPDFLDDLEA